MVLIDGSEIKKLNLLLIQYILTFRGQSLFF